MPVLQNLEQLYLLAGLIAITLLVIILGNAHRRKVISILKKDHDLDIIKHSNLSQSGRRLRYSLLILILLITAFCILRPQGQKIPQQKISSSRSILFLVDISKSMNVEDMNEQSRLNYSKWWAKKLMEDVPGDRYGLITFSKIANIECPLTSDPEMVQLYLADLNSSLLPGGGTNIAEALDHAQQQFKENERDSRVVVLLSDGETKDDKWKEALEALNKKNIPVNVIGLGDPTKAGLVLDDRGRPIRGSDNSYVMSSSDTSTLKQIADETGGVYIPWDPNQALKSGHLEVIQRIEELEYNDDSEEQVELREELFMYFLPFAMVLLSIRLWISESIQRKASLFICLFVCLSPNIKAQPVLPTGAQVQPQISAEEIQVKIAEIAKNIAVQPKALHDYETSREAIKTIEAPAQLLLPEIQQLLKEAQKHPELELPILTKLIGLEHRAALETKPDQQVNKLNTIIDKYIELLCRFPNSNILQHNLDLAIQQRDKAQEQQKQQEDQQNKDQKQNQDQQKDEKGKDQQKGDNQQKDNQGKEDKSQHNDQKDKDQKDGEKSNQENKKPQENQQKTDQKNPQQSGSKNTHSQTQNQMTEAEAEAAFKDDLKRQQRLRDLIRQNREAQNQRRRPFNPEQDK